MYMKKVLSIPLVSSFIIFILFAGISSPARASSLSLEQQNQLAAIVLSFDSLKSLFNKLKAAIMKEITPARAAGSINSPLRVDPQNPRYFMDGAGKAVYLAGSHTWSLIHKRGIDDGHWDEIPTYDTFEKYLDFMESHGQNYVRLWTGMSYLDYPPFPWKRTGPGTAVDGMPKFNMTDFNQSYFDMLKERITQVENRGMYASVMIFGSHNRKKSNFTQVAWNEYNNINPELASAFSNVDGYSFFTTDPAALEIQKKTVRKFIDELNGFDNIFWEVINEPGGTPEAVAWHNTMIDYIHSYESSKPKQHLVMMGGGWDLGTKMLSSNADVISPDWDSYTYGGPANYSSKIVISDTDHIPPWDISKSQIEDIRKWVWETFTRGNNPIYMDPYKSYNPQSGDSGGYIDHDFDPIRDAMGYTLNYANKFTDLAAMVPSSDTSYCSTSYCLRNPGQEYLVYQPNSDQFTVNLPANDYDYEWFNPQTGSVAGTGTITANGGNKSFTPPFSGDAVLYLKKTISYTPSTSIPSNRSLLLFAFLNPPTMLFRFIFSLSYAPFLPSTVPFFPFQVSYFKNPDKSRIVGSGYREIDYVRSDAELFIRVGNFKLVGAYGHFL